MDDFCNKRVLITGATGFVGSHMAERMVREKAQVFVLARENSDLWRIEALRDRITVLRADIRDRGQVERTVQEIQPEYVFHMAAYGVDSRQRDSYVAGQTNIMGIINLMNALKESCCRKILNIGSCMEYGDKQEIIREDAVLEPYNSYGSTKAAATIVAHQLARDYKLDIITLRAFGIFGENEGSHKLFPHIVLSILSGCAVNLTACEQFRDYCYVENIIDAFVLAAGARECKNEIFNIGSGAIQPLKFYVDKVFAYMHPVQKPRYGAVPYRQDEVWKPHPDVTKIRTLLKWEPKICLEEGLVRTINWYKDNLKKYLGTGR